MNIDDLGYVSFLIEYAQGFDLKVDLHSLVVNNVAQP